VSVVVPGSLAMPSIQAKGCHVVTTDA